MPGLHAQSMRKKLQRSVDMSPTAEPACAWTPPAEDQLEKSDPYTFAPTDADPKLHQIKVSMFNEIGTNALVKFAIVQLTYHRGRWRQVAAVDSCHYDQVHLHPYGRKVDARVGDPEVLMEIAGLEDVQTGYDLAYVAIVDRWSANYQRWQYA